MIVTETAVYLLRNARPVAPGNHGRAGLSHYSAQCYLRAIHRDSIAFAALAELACSSPAFGPKHEARARRLARRITKHLAALCGRRVKVAFAGDPRGWCVRFHDYNDNPEQDQPKGGY